MVWAAIAGVLEIGSTVEVADEALWPKTLPEQIAAVRAGLADLGEATPEQVARQPQTRACGLGPAAPGKLYRSWSSPQHRGQPLRDLINRQAGASKTLCAALSAADRPKEPSPVGAICPDPRADRRSPRPGRTDVHVPPQDAPAIP